MADVVEDALACWETIQALTSDLAAARRALRVQWPKRLKVEPSRDAMLDQMHSLEQLLEDLAEQLAEIANS